MRAPCFECEDRKLKCHADCERYKAYIAEYREFKKRKYKDADYIKYLADKKVRREKEQKYHKR